MVIVDDNELTRNGFADAFVGDGRFDLVATIDHRTALSWTDEWSSIDAVLLDAADEGEQADQFPGVRVAKHIRAHGGARDLVLTVVTGHYFDDGLRHRMAEAGADFFFLRSDVRSNETLRRIVHDPESFRRRGVPKVADQQTRTVLGLTDRSNVEGVIDYIASAGLADHFDPSQPAADDLSRRAWLRHRKGLEKAGKIKPVNKTTGVRPTGENERAPSRDQLARLWRWSARVKRGPVTHEADDPPRDG